VQLELMAPPELLEPQALLDLLVLKEYKALLVLLAPRVLTVLTA